MKGTDHSKRTIQMYLGTACRGRCVFCEELLHVFSYSEIRRIDINWLMMCILNVGKEADCEMKQ